MSMQDPIADMLAMIKNALARKKESVTLPSSKQKVNICNVLIEEGYLAGVLVSEDKAKPQLTIKLKYHKNQPVIATLKRVSKPSLRRYEPKSSLPNFQGGLGIAVVSTSKGMMTDKRARVENLGGEIICFVS